MIYTVPFRHCTLDGRQHSKLSIPSIIYVLTNQIAKLLLAY